MSCGCHVLQRFLFRHVRQSCHTINRHVYKHISHAKLLSATFILRLRSFYRSTTASLRVSYIIGKAMLTYCSGPIIKECMAEAVETLFPGQDDITRGIESLALSRPTVSKRIDVIATNLYETALSQLLQAK